VVSLVLRLWLDWCCRVGEQRSARARMRVEEEDEGAVARARLKVVE
jgi:hypothetical protein